MNKCVYCNAEIEEDSWVDVCMDCTDEDSDY